MTQRVKTAPPVSTTSTIFITTSIEIIEINDMPHAVLKAYKKVISLYKIIVSNNIDVRSPLTIARTIIEVVDQSELVN